MNVYLYSPVNQDIRFTTQSQSDGTTSPSVNLDPNNVEVYTPPATTTVDSTGTTVETTTGNSVPGVTQDSVSSSAAVVQTYNEGDELEYILAAQNALKEGDIQTLQGILQVVNTNENLCKAFWASDQIDTNVVNSMGESRNLKDAYVYLAEEMAARGAGVNDIKNILGPMIEDTLGKVNAADAPNGINDQLESQASSFKGNLVAGTAVGGILGKALLAGKAGTALTAVQKGLSKVFPLGKFGGFAMAATGGFMAGKFVGDAVGDWVENKTGSKTWGDVSAVASGAAAGALVGSIVPGVGTAVGAVVGGIAGGIGAWMKRNDVSIF